MAFIAFEGLDGSGKSTLIQGLRKEVESRQVPVVVTREPGGTPLGEELRQIVLKVTNDAPGPRAEALLYQAGRAQHVEKLIKPALARGEWVLTDRYTASSVAFQSGGRSLSIDDIDWLNRFSTEGLEPDLNVLLDLSVEESLRRLQGRNQEIDRFERENKAFHQKVRDTYLQLAKKTPAKWLVLSSSEPSDRLLHLLVAELKQKKWLK